MISTNRRAPENFLVAAAGQTALSNAANSGSSINNGLAVLLNDGQLGIVAASAFGTVALNNFTDGTPTVQEAPIIQIYQGNANSSNPSLAQASATYPLWARPYEVTAPIDGRGRVVVTKQAYRTPLHNVWVIGSEDGNTDAINVLSNTEYRLSIAFRGRRQEEMYTGEQTTVIHPTLTTPDFSSTGLNLTNEQAIDYITTYMVYNINRNSKALTMNTRFQSKAPVVAFLISSAGGAGTEIGGLSPIAAGDVISVVTTTSGTRNITLTSAMATSIKNAAIAATGDVIADVTWTIVTADLANAGVVSAAACDRIMLMALDETLAYSDKIPQVKVSLRSGLTYGFDYTKVYNEELVYADEGQGDGRTLDLLYKATHGQRKYSLNHVEDPVINFPSPVDTTATYTVYNITHGRTDMVDSLNLIYSPFREIILIPSSNTTLVTNLDTALNAFLASGSNQTVLSAD